jgi:hypothetical protein
MVRGDPEMPVSDAQHREREAFLVAVLGLQRRAWDAAQRFGVRLQGGFGGAPAPASGDSLGAARTRLASALRGLNGIASDMNGAGVRPGTLYPPTETQKRRKQELETQLNQAIATLERLGGR